MIFLDGRAMLAGETLELDHVETAAGDDQARLVAEGAGRAGDHGGDHVIDVVLDVDPGLVEQLVLALAGRQNLPEALSEFGIEIVVVFSTKVSVTTVEG